MTKLKLNLSEIETIILTRAVGNKMERKMHLYLEDLTILEQINKYLKWEEIISDLETGVVEL